MVYNGSLLPGQNSGPQTLALSSNSGVAMTISVDAIDGYSGALPSSRFAVTYVTSESATTQNVNFPGSFSGQQFNAVGSIPLDGTETSLTFTVANTGIASVTVSLVTAANASGTAIPNHILITDTTAHAVSSAKAILQIINLDLNAQACNLDLGAGLSAIGPLGASQIITYAPMPCSGFTAQASSTPSGKGIMVIYE